MVIVMYAKGEAGFRVGTMIFYTAGHNSESKDVVLMCVCPLDLEL